VSENKTKRSKVVQRFQVRYIFGGGMGRAPQCLPPVQKFFGETRFSRK